MWLAAPLIGCVYVAGMRADEKAAELRGGSSGGALFHGLVFLGAVVMMVWLLRSVWKVRRLARTAVSEEQIATANFTTEAQRTQRE